MCYHLIYVHGRSHKLVVRPALTKGLIDSDALLKAMAGSYECVHPCKMYSKRSA